MKNTLRCWVAVALLVAGVWGCNRREPAPPPPGAPKESELLTPPSVDLGTPLQRPAAADKAPADAKK